MKIRYILFLLFFFIATFFSYIIYIEINGLESLSKINITIKKGDTAKIISSLLLEKGVIKMPFLLEKYLVLTKRDRSIKPGKHLFSIRESYSKISKELITENHDYIKLTIPEGFTKIEIMKRLSEVFDNKKVKKAFFEIEEKGILFYGKNIHDLEGLLFPDTYNITKNDDIKRIIMIMNSRFLKVFNDCIKNSEKKMNPYDSLILASIIEKEAKENDEKKRISGVFINRLNIGMPLDSCATVEYALIQKDGKRKSRLYYKDIKIESKYNTYIYKGLPPGPICCPGKISIEAAINPEKHSYLYFISTGDRHHFSKTLREHVRWKKKLKKQY